jgi:hypothetical protein
MLAKVGFVKGVGLARPSEPRTNLTGDPYFTDGFRAVMILEQGPIALDQIRSLNWEAPKSFQIGASKDSSAGCGLVLECP